MSSEEVSQQRLRALVPFNLECKAERKYTSEGKDGLRMRHEQLLAEQEAMRARMTLQREREAAGDAKKREERGPKAKARRRTYDRLYKREVRLEGRKASRAEHRAEKAARRARWQQMMDGSSLRREQRDAIKKKLEERSEGYTEGFIAGFFEGQRFVTEGGINGQQPSKQ